MGMSDAALELFRQRSNFIIIGLTGATGSGCTTVANLLKSPANHFIFNHRHGLDTPAQCEIIEKYFKSNWNEFHILRIRDIISTYILECTFDEIKTLFAHINSRIDIENFRSYFEEIKSQSLCLDCIYKSRHHECDHSKIFNFISNTLPSFTKHMEEYLNATNEKLFIAAYQKIGDNIRKYGDALERSASSTEHIFELAYRSNQIIKSLRHYNESNGRKDYFAIDSIRNPAEARFFQERYSSFYLLAIKTTTTERHDRLTKINRLRIDEIENIDNKESNLKSTLKDMDSFISQDIPGCVELADIHISNTGDHTNTALNHLHYQIAKYFCLIHHPGLIMPTEHERNMQIAVTAKLNSGCLSRQVGAVVTDHEGNLLSIGWNDVPKGQTPCKLRSIHSYVNRLNDEDFSAYEIKDLQIKKHVTKLHESSDIALNLGLTPSYCFKSIQNKIEGEKNQVHTRAVHAEENAFLALSGRASTHKHSRLYTTASPCVLCAKKAYQLEIKEIYYIDPYPDITFDHIINCGTSIPKTILFSGAIGGAYHRLYRPILPLKDELEAHLSSRDMQTTPPDTTT